VSNTLCRQSVRDLAIDQSQGFGKLNDDVQAVHNSQNLILMDVKLQTDVLLGNSMELHEKTLATYQRGNEDIINQLHRLQLQNLDINPKLEEQEANETRKWPLNSKRGREPEACSVYSALFILRPCMIVKSKSASRTKRHFNGSFKSREVTFINGTSLVPG